jgi:acyl carrier protein
VTATDTPAQTAAQIENWLKAHIAGLIGQTPEEIDSDADFDSFGIDSVQGVDMVVALESWLDMPDDLPMELLFEAPTLADAARRVAEAKKAQAAR